MNLKDIWNSLLSKYTADAVLINKLWSQIESCYTSPGRYYHNLSHLDYMIEKSIIYKNRISDPDTLLFSVFYHDIIYDPTRNDNEGKSAETAREALTNTGVLGDRIAKCEQQILSTKDHEGSADLDTNYLIDLDLAILGESVEKYNEYSLQIRKEYSMYNNMLYNEGRKKVLRHFIDREKIFKTEDFYKKYELQARYNLQSELDNLSR